MKAIINFVSLAMAIASVSAQGLRGGPFFVLSDVAITDVDRERREWSGKTAVIADILEEDFQENFQDVIADILEEDFQDDAEVSHDKINKPFWGFMIDFREDSKKTCGANAEAFDSCLKSEGDTFEDAKACVDCFNSAIHALDGTECSSVKEACKAVRQCVGSKTSQKYHPCNYHCSDVVHDLVACSINQMGCDGDEYKNECSVVF
ncbi:hypothetical protein ACHAW5_004845 [Stephanodiscus triporus]|uniref:Uncharacterized protein n=1 Tax=Stephanodiscus triporus TaxID=2934178 RepID=A0ABD3MIV9_9STRA